MKSVIYMDIRKLKRSLRALLTAGLVVIACTTTVLADTAFDPDSTTRQLISYYLTYQENARTDICRLVDDLTGSSSSHGNAWRKIMDFWSYANTEMSVPTGVLPDGLADDDSLCIVVLGYQLGTFGTIRPELAGRLEVALASAEKYPNAYILCTGGATASRNQSKTEAGQMSKWLQKHGVSEDRIIEETQAYSTIANATYSCKLLAEKYPQVKHLALISSDYHVPLGCIYLYTQSMVNTYELGTPELDIVGCAAYDTGRSDPYGVATQAQGIAQIAGVSGFQSLKPQLSQLTGITLDGEYSYETGTAMSVRVEASYDTGATRDVTADAVFSGVNMNSPGEQLLQVYYEENGITATAEVLIDVTGMPLLEASAPAQVASTDDSSASYGSAAPLWPFIMITALLALVVLLIRLRYTHL